MTDAVATFLNRSSFKNLVICGENQIEQCDPFLRTDVSETEQNYLDKKNSKRKRFPENSNVHV